MAQTYYTVVRAVPDPIAGEYINIGVVVFGDGRIRARFVQDWRRVECFTQEDVTYLQDFVARFEVALPRSEDVVQRSLLGWPRSRDLSEEVLRRMADEWGSSIQFSPIEVAIQDPDALLLTLSELFLKESPPQRRGYRDASAAARLADRWIRNAFRRQIGPTRTDNVVLFRRKIPGKKYDRNQVDVLVNYDRFYSATRGLSFEIQNRDNLESQIRNAVLELGDLRDVYQDLDLSIVALPPGDPSKAPRFAGELYREAERYCARIGARFVPEEIGETWAEEVAQEILPMIQHRTTGAEAALLIGNSGR